jgi:hypothetical protein
LLQVVLEPKGLGPDWFLDYVTVANATTGVTAKFPFADWFSAKTGWSHLLTPEGRQADTVSGGGCHCLLDQFNAARLTQ